MKLDELLLKIRAIVREELQMALSTQTNNQTLSTNIKESKHVVSKPKIHNVINQQKSKTVTYSKNPVINRILNETKLDSNFMSENQVYDDMSEWPTMSYNNNPHISMSGNTVTSTNEVNLIPNTDLNGRPVNLSNVEDHVLSALSKDYSKLMKAIEKRKGK